MEFEVKSARQVGSIQMIDENTRKMFINVIPAVVGLPDEDKYYLKEVTTSVEFDVDETTTTAYVNSLVDSTAIQYVIDNY
jgi:hypothetical protein